MADEIDYKAMGKRIKRLQRMQDLTQEQLAELVGCTKSFIGCVENNSSIPSIATIVRIATALGVTPDYFLLGIDPDEKSTQRIAKKINLALTATGICSGMNTAGGWPPCPMGGRYIF